MSCSTKDQASKRLRRERRKMHIRRSVYGTAERPRLTIFRSAKNMYCQVIDDYRGVTIASASTVAKDLRGGVGPGGNCDAAKLVGKAIAERARAAGVESVRFDRNGYRFHGRVKALADAAREAGLKL